MEGKAMKSKVMYIMIAVVILAVAVLSGCASPGSKETPVPIEGTIVFAAPHEGGQYADIYLLDAQGTHMLSGGGLTTAANPAWSLDGTKIAYITNTFQLAVINRDGSSGSYLTADMSDDASYWPSYPAWLPDGNISIAVGGKIAILGPDGSGVHMLAPTQLSGAYAWSPDGSQIVYDCSILSQAEACLFDVESGESRSLFQPPGPFVSLDWSPDGKSILGAVGYTRAFSGDVDDAVKGLYVFDANGQGLHALTEPGNKESAAWSPDGKQVVYEFNVEDSEGSNFGLGMMNLDGSGVQPLVGAVGFRGPEMDAEASGLFGRQPDWTAH
jgi:Tol biopolymer transport system component